jgi:hypothetical protein
MSQFSSARGRGNYAYAGKVAADDALRSFIAARESSPDYGKLAQEAAKIRSAEKIAAIEAQTKVAKTGIAVKADLKATEIKTKAETDYKKTVRKAGLLAAAGRSGGIGLMKLGEKPLERRDSSADLEYYDKQIEKTKAEIAKINDGTLSISTSTDSNNTGDQQGGNSAGKVDGPVSSAEAMQVTGYTPPKGQKSFSVPEMQSLLVNAGMPADKARTLAAVGMGESGGNAGIDTVKSGLDPNKSNEFSIGLFQINTQAHMDKLAKRGYSIEDLRDPQKNAQIAVDVYNEVGSFKPWSVYNSGKHIPYLTD